MTPATPHAKGTPRRMRSGKVVLPVVAVLLIALALGSRACGTDAQNVSQQQALEIATAAAGFPVTDSRVQFVRQGMQSMPAWVVGVKGSDGEAKTFVIDGRNGSIIRIVSE